MRTMQKLSLVVVLAATGWSPASVAAPAAETSRALRRSDVVFMYDNPAMYQPYGCTVLGWAGRANADHIRQAHEKGVRLFSSSVGFLTEFRGVIDFSDQFLDAACRNFAGEPFIVPWLWDHKYKGQSAWWWCTNSPLYRAYLFHRLEQVMAAGPDGLHVDDYRGTSGSVTWLSGCFCRHCMAAFRKWLAENVPAERLRELGIDNLDRFDYRQYLLDRGVTLEQYKRRRKQLPLAEEFYRFHVEAATGFLIQYHKRGEELRSKPLALCVNSGLNNPQALVIAPHVSYFCCEVRHDAAKGAASGHPIYVYKLAEGLRRPVASTASGHDWAFVNEHHTTALVRSWIALSYAFGHNFMAPHRQWCYTKEKGTHWYSGPTEEYAYVYRFVRHNARLLDGYEAVAPVGLVYDNAARRRGIGNVEPIAVELAHRNIPFSMVIAGDDWLPYRLSADQLAQFRAVVVPSQLAMDAPQRQVLEQVDAAGRLVRWPNDEKLDRLIGRPVIVDLPPESLLVVPRTKPHDRTAPLAVHLVSRRYDTQRRAMIPLENFTLRLHKSLFSGRSSIRATLHAPKTQLATLSVQDDGQYYRVTIPQIPFWAILELAGS